MWNRRQRQSASTMNIHRAIVFVVLASLACACSPSDSDQAKKSVEQVKDKTKEVAEDAAEKTKEAVSGAAEKGKQIVSQTGEVITDGWITTKVKAKFSDEKLLKDADISVDTKDRVVTLKGAVPSADARKRAIAIADGTEGVLRVVDEMKLKGK